MKRSQLAVDLTNEVATLRRFALFLTKSYEDADDLVQDTLERALLKSVGYGLSLTDDAVPCPRNAPLVYVSPTSGRAVSSVVGDPYFDRMLRLPALWGGPSCSEIDDAHAALTLTGEFLRRAVHGKPLTTRVRLVEILVRREPLSEEQKKWR